MRSPKNLCFSDGFKGNRSQLIHLNSLNIRDEIRRWSLILYKLETVLNLAQALLDTLKADSDTSVLCGSMNINLVKWT